MSSEKPLETITIGAGIVFLGLIISKILGFFYRLIVARIGTEEFGLLSLGLVIYGVFVVISMLGLNEGVLRYVSYYREKKEFSKVKGTLIYSLKLTSLISIIFAILIFIFSDFISIKIFHNQRLSIILKIISFAIPFDVFRNILYEVAKAYKKIQYMVISKNIVENLTKVILTSVFVYLGFGVIGAAWAYLLAILASFSLIFFNIEKNVFSFIRNKITSVYDKKQLLSYSIPLLFYYAVILAISWIDTLFLGILKTASDVGIYNAALPISSLIYLFPTALLALFVPVLTDLYANKDEKRFSLTYTTVTKWIFMINLILLSMFVIFPKKILLTLFGSSYVSGYSALIALSIGSFFYALSLTSNQLLLVYERTKTISLITSIGALINIVLNLILIPKYGIFGAGIATAISLIIMSLSFFIVSFRIIKINPYKSIYQRIIISAIISSIAAYYLIKLFNFLPNLISLILTAIILLVFYFITLLITRSINEDDLIILRLIQNKLNIRIPFLNKLIRKFI